eukprot:TRINITY_DN3114_c0_g3_i2.p1 TRINITY_DN3114_c0_g3~~TRINITY_DN3114_c0_g3_i2.p1  ORF type:complete len:418 (-),score=129.00 TRINITY_DN3114_c0_g3_i2:57-1310(-)
MKRDWMQTGRRPSGVCGAALFIAAKIHHFSRTIIDIIGVVRVGETTVKKRLAEFEDTQTSAITVAEFTQMVDQWDDPLEITAGPVPNPEDIVECSHCEKMLPRYDKGLCQECYEEFVKVSGGCFADSRDPSAFTRNREIDYAKGQAQLALKQTSTEALEAASSEMHELLTSSQFAELERVPGSKHAAWTRTQAGDRAVMVCSMAAAPLGVISTAPPGGGTVPCFDEVVHSTVTVKAVVMPSEPVCNTTVRARDEEELDEDDDDDETRGSLLSAEEVACRTKVWEEMNKDYTEAQKDRERLIRLGILKPRASRKRKVEAGTAEEAMAGVISKKHIAGVDASIVTEIPKPVPAIEAAAAPEKKKEEEEPVEGEEKEEEKEEEEEEEDDDDDDEPEEGMMSQSRANRLKAREAAEEEEYD